VQRVVPVELVGFSGLQARDRRRDRYWTGGWPLTRTLLHGGRLAVDACLQPHRQSLSVPVDDTSYRNAIISARAGKRVVWMRGRVRLCNLIPQVLA